MTEEGIALDLATKKVVLRQLTYGLYAVTAAHAGGRGVFTANWLTQVSFDPPLLALSVEQDSSTGPLIEASGLFAVCPLRDDQRDLAGALGRPKARAGDKFVRYNLAVRPSTHGVPVLSDSLGYLVARVTDRLTTGDSVLFIAEVIEAAVFADALPLSMRAAGFRHAG